MRRKGLFFVAVAGAFILVFFTLVGRGASDDAPPPKLVAKGKVIFEKTAMGIGCAFCHGLDGRGKAEFASPNIRGKTAGDVFDALQTRAQMRAIKLTDDDLDAVAAYLKVLNGQP